MRELGSSPFHYAIPIIPRSFPSEVIEGEYFVPVNVLKSVPGSSSQAIFAQEDQTKVAVRSSMGPAHVALPKCPQPAPPACIEERDVGATIKSNRCRVIRFLDWAGLIDSEPTKEKEMFSLATGFTE